MTDIVARLRATALDKDNFPRMDSERWLPVGLAREAAAEIERLWGQAQRDEKSYQAEIERLRGIEQFADEASRQQREGLQAEIERLRDDSRMLALCEGDRKKMADEIERLRAALEQIEQWGRAYPLSVFPEPDLKLARELLEAGGMTLDAISADAMRHVVDGVFQIARRALEPKP